MAHSISSVPTAIKQAVPEKKEVQKAVPNGGSTVEKGTSQTEENKLSRKAVDWP